MNVKESRGVTGVTISSCQRHLAKARLFTSGGILYDTPLSRSAKLTECQAKPENKKFDFSFQVMPIY